MNYRQFLLTILSIFLLSANINGQEPTVDEYIEKGIFMHDAGQYTHALETYQKALDLEPENQRVLYEMALSNYELQNYATAIELAERSLKNGEDLFVDNNVLIGSAQDKMGDSKAALRTFKKALKKAPDAHGLYFNQGITQYGIKEMEEASSSFQRAVLIDPSHVESHLYLASVEMERGNRIPSILAWYHYLLLEKDQESNENALMKIDDLLFEKEGYNEIAEIDTKKMAMAIEDVRAEISNSEVDDPYQKYKLATTKLFASLPKIEYSRAENAWQYYSGFYSTIQANDHTPAFICFTAFSYPDSWEWRYDHQAEVAKFTRWFSQTLNVDAKK